MFMYKAPFEYGAQVRNDPCYKIHSYLEERKLAAYQSPFDSPYPKLDIDLKYFKVLCQEGNCCNKGDVNGQTPLHALCLYGSVDSINILLELGANKDCKDNFNYTLIHYCAMSDREDLLKFLVDEGVSMTEQKSVNGRNPLHIASMCNSGDCVAYLLDRENFDINEIDYFGCTPLWLALYYGHDGVCRQLYDRRAQLLGPGMVVHIFRAGIKCDSFAKSILDSMVSTCSYRGVSGYWLNRLVDEVSYKDEDMTHSYLHIKSVGDEFVKHPVIHKYIKVLWKKAGMKHAVINLTRDFLYSLTWTFHFMSETGKTFRDQSSVIKLVAYIILLPFTCYLIYQKISIIKTTYYKKVECLSHEQEMVDREFENNHPCMWNLFNVLKREKKELSKYRKKLFIEKVLSHQSLELVIIVLSLIVLIMDLVMTGINTDKHESHRLEVFYMVVSSVVLVLVWANTFLKFRYFKGFSIFITTVHHLYKVLLKFSLMFLVFYIPISCVFWKTIYDSPRVHHGKTHNASFFDSLYTVYRMTYSDYTYSTGLDLAVKAGYPAWWNILTFYWITLGSLILLQILGGMIYVKISSTPDHKKLIALRQRMDFICEMMMTKKTSERQALARHLELDCKPYVVDTDVD